MTSQDDHPNRIEELRKYAAIYGRFDSKRKNDRPMSLHEVCELTASFCASSSNITLLICCLAGQQF